MMFISSKHSSQLTCVFHIVKEDLLDEYFRILGWNLMCIAIVDCNLTLSLTCPKGLQKVASPEMGGDFVPVAGEKLLDSSQFLTQG